MIMKDVLLFVIKATLILLLCAGCVEAPESTSSGEILARQHCIACHAFPDPSLLDKKTWTEGVLPLMKNRLGLYDDVPRDSLVAQLRVNQIDPDLVYPEKPVLTDTEWASLVDYYRKAAPDSNTFFSQNPSIKKISTRFEPQRSALRIDPPLTTFVQIDPAFKAFFVGNYASNNTLLLIQYPGKVMYQFDLAGAPIAAKVDGQTLYIATIGAGPEPTIRAEGSIYAVSNPSAPPERLITDLKRPVDLQVGDLNEDGLLDLVICEFGFHDGYVSLYLNKGDNHFERHELFMAPGAVKAALHDFDQDGRMDIGVLMAQGDEGFDIYYNLVGVRFKRTRVLRFPPLYGSNHFELADINADGHIDLITTHGDNADSSPVLKPYHGIRIFLGDGAQNFEERFFYPLNGAIAARTADFDKDGDLDIAAIAYFPDYAHTPEESFILLNQTGSLTFEAATIEHAARGRWIVMDVNDIDADNDMDILLGSNIGFGPKGDDSGLYERWQTSSPSYLVLENNTTHP